MVIDLHTHSSESDGTDSPAELVKAAALAGLDAVAITDHGNLFGAVPFFEAAEKRGIKPILGCEVYVASGSRFDKSGPQTETNHLVLLAETDRGYKNLIKLVSAGYTEGFYYRPRIDRELLAQHADGLIGLSSCLKGEVASALKVEQQRQALDAAARLRDILGANNFFLEMQYQGLEEQKIVNRGIVPLARELELPLVCTNDVHYLKQGDHQPHDILLCIGTGKTVNRVTECWLCRCGQSKNKPFCDGSHKVCGFLLSAFQTGRAISTSARYRRPANATRGRSLPKRAAPSATTQMLVEETAQSWQPLAASRRVSSCRAGKMRGATRWSKKRRPPRTACSTRR